MAFDHSSLRWFEISTCIAIPKSLPSSSVQHSCYSSDSSCRMNAPSWRTIICVSLERCFWVVLRHPNIKYIMHKHIRQSRTNYTAMAFDHSSIGLFDGSTCLAPTGGPSSITFVPFVAHQIPACRITAPDSSGILPSVISYS